ncbi:uncharacterized protein LOC143277042 isoform X2 [Babylonia areolata]|uniref:uncharacterized protein LOC143277042 isoform X2 n=1 Tax=Babylonia areolata TaxID=304850 RepID=UPI003FD20642
MSATPDKNKPFLTSSQREFRHSCDVNQTVPYHVQAEDTFRGEADDTESLTLDSLEEDDIEVLNYGHFFDDAPSLAMELKNAGVSVSRNGDKLHNAEYKQSFTNTEPRSISNLPSDRNGAPKSDHDVASMMNTNSSSRSSNENDASDTIHASFERRMPDAARDARPKAGTSQICSESSGSTPEVYTAGNRGGGQQGNRVAQGTNREVSTSPASFCRAGSVTSVDSLGEPAATENRTTVARRPQSLLTAAGGGGGDLASQKNRKPSGIPRRQGSDQSLRNRDHHGSAKSSPAPSPPSLRRSLTLNSADVARNRTGSPLSEAAGLVRKSPSGLRQEAVGGLGKSPSTPPPGTVEGLGRKSPPSPKPGRQSPSGGPRGEDCFPACEPFWFSASWDSGKRGKRGSVCETMSTLSGPLSRDTIASRLRIQKQHQAHECHDHHHHHHSNGASTDAATCGGGGGGAGGAGGGMQGTYLTPSQRKEETIRSLKGQVMYLTRQIQAREAQLKETKETASEEKERIQTQLGRQLDEARGLAETARQEVTSLQESHQESVKTVAALQQELEDVKKETAEKLARAEEIFLEMYKKGRDSAIFEHEEEMELHGKDASSLDATEAELRQKLMRTQAELARWQTIQRRDTYHAVPLPATEAETTLAFLKDSMYHFLTSDKVPTSDEHLRAIVRMLNFSEAQREKIAQSVVTKRNKSVL